MQTKELLRIAEEEEEAPAKPSTSGTRITDDAPEQRWDCESVLSLRSNLDNHPGVISEQSNRRYRSAGGKIRLAAKTGQHQRSVLAKCDPHGPSSRRESDLGRMCGCCMALFTCMCPWAFRRWHRQLARFIVCCGVCCDAVVHFALMFYTSVLLRQQKGCQALTLTRLYDWSHIFCIHATAWQHLSNGAMCV